MLIQGEFIARRGRKGLAGHFFKEFPCLVPGECAYLGIVEENLKGRPQVPAYGGPDHAFLVVHMPEDHGRQRVGKAA